MMRMYFGVPGCGKTTTAVYNAIKNRRKYDYIYANFDVSSKVARTCNLEGLGQWTFPPRSLIEIDESSIEYNNRKFKSLPIFTISWFKLRRHFRCDVDLYSQSWDDVDITLRRLTDELWHCKKVFCFTILRRIYKYLTVDEQTHQIVDGYRLARFWTCLIPFYGAVKLVFRPRYYKYFDSYSTPDTPIKYWGVEDIENDSSLSAEATI